MKTYADIACVGELIVDFISTGTGADLSVAPGFLKKAGGAAANVAAGCARLGVTSRFLGRVGNDAFGRFLRRELAGSGVDVSGVRADPHLLTRLAFVSRSRIGERDFEFHENHPADQNFHRGDIRLPDLARSRIVHFSSFLLLNEPARSALFSIAESLLRNGTIISFDPNLRAGLWKSDGEARRILNRFIRFAVLLRLNDEEAGFLTGHRSAEKAANALMSRGPDLVVITQGAAGCYLRSRYASAYCRGFRTKAVDTTGCGDAFLAGLLTGVLKHAGAVRDLSTGILQEIGTFANAAGALTATRFGVIGALPSAAEVRRLIERGKRR